jgi:DeoR family transcriptional regulator of aga operon
MTSRRDIAALDSEGKVVKTLRGAMRVPPGGLLTEGPLHERLGENIAAKRGIARAAVGLISPGDTLHLDGGSTCIELARIIAQSQLAVTVVTNSVFVSACFCDGSGAKVIQVGGALNPLNGCATGTDAEAAAKRYHIDMGFFTTRGYVIDEGTYESSVDTLRVKRAFAKRSSRVILLLDHTKFGKRAPHRVFADANISHVITDKKIHGLKDDRFIVAS